LRATAFLIADGVLPSNEGRGYVLRRIMRRAMRHAFTLGSDLPVLYKILPTLISEMSSEYSELKRADSLITENLKLARPSTCPSPLLRGSYGQARVPARRPLPRVPRCVRRWERHRCRAAAGSVAGERQSVAGLVHQRADRREHAVRGGDRGVA